MRTVDRKLGREIDDSTCHTEFVKRWKSRHNAVSLRLDSQESSSLTVEQQDVPRQTPQLHGALRRITCASAQPCPQSGGQGKLRFLGRLSMQHRREGEGLYKQQQVESRPNASAVMTSTKRESHFDSDNENHIEDAVVGHQSQVA
ncbi:hypothetical protein AC249_AIPGENE3052 [Exaiptasia diaphana]|nr:hypothetical protein AC249_AIPGENE3052 [Exaiptasia diaphana]